MRAAAAATTAAHRPGAATTAAGADLQAGTLCHWFHGDDSDMYRQLEKSSSILLLKTNVDTNTDVTCRGGS